MIAGDAAVVGAVRDVLATILPGLDPHQVGGDRHLRDLGADSVDRVEIILGLMERLGVDEPLASFGDLPDVDALVAFLTERRGRPA